jgi:light-regulated signal transduction histidine kinase (bacteriophytochrome)
METVDEIDSPSGNAPRSGNPRTCLQPSCYFLELSLDWIVLRASENIHHLLGESHVTLIDEPLGKFVHSQALHDLRNLFSRLSGTTGIARAYSVRLTDDPDLVDISFQLSEGHVLLEAVRSAGCFGEYFGSVGGLVAGLSGASGKALLEGAARRMRALTGFDRVTLKCGDDRAESSRGSFAGPADPADLPMIIGDAEAPGIELFPRGRDESSAHEALMRAPSSDNLQKLRDRGIRAILRIIFNTADLECEFCCENRSPHEMNLELHAAAELFAQMFSLQLQLDQASKR